MTVIATLADAFILSQPYDARGAFMLLHAIDDRLEGVELRGVGEATHRHVTAALDGEERRLEAARASMIRLAVELDRLRRADACAPTWRASTRYAGAGGSYAL